MYDTYDKAMQNEALRVLVRNCKRYDMPGEFITHNPNIESNESGLYFVTGIDVNRVKRRQYNPAELVANQERNMRFFQPIMAFKVTGCDPDVLLHDVAMYCWYAEFVAKVFPQYNMKVYKNLLQSKVESLAEFYTHTINTGYSDFIKQKFQSEFRILMNKLRDSYERKGIRGMWRDFSVSNKYNDKKGAIYNIVSFMFRKRNRVSREIVNLHSDGTLNMSMEWWRYKEFAKEIKKYPDAIYWLCPKKRIESIGLVKQEKKPPRNNKYKFVMISFPRNLEKVICSAYANAIYKPDAPMTAEEIVQSGEPINALVAPACSFHNYQSLLAANNVPYAIDPGYVNHPKLDHVPILYFAEDKEMVDAITRRLCNGVASYHIIENEDADAIRLQTNLYGHLLDMEEIEDTTRQIYEHEQKMKQLYKEAKKKRNEIEQVR